MIAIMADLHARGKDLPAFRRQFERALTVCAERRVDAVLLAGDVFHRSNLADGPATSGAVIEAVARPLSSFCRDTGIPVYAIPGNHDKESDTQPDALHSIEHITGVEVIRSPLWFRVAGVQVLFLPWFYGVDAAEIMGNMIDCRPKGTTLLCAHVSIMGGRMNRSSFARAGTFMLTEADLAGFDHVALGDFHPRQDLTGGKGGYVGALRQLDFGAAGDPQGFEIWDPATNTTEWVELDESPRHEILEWLEGEPRPEPTPGYLTRITTPGWRPAEADKIPGVSFSAQTEKTPARVAPERIASVLKDPHALLDLWLESNPVTDAPYLHALLDTLRQ